MADRQVTIIGGGVIGLSCAYYLQKEGYEVTVIDRGEITDGTSFGNAGYVSPSHFIPLASPYIVYKAMKWMLDASSPFYIKPKLDRDLVRWGMAFWRSANLKTMRQNIPPLNDILALSRTLMNAIRDDLGDHFRMEEKGCFMLYKSVAAARTELQLAKEAASYGLEARCYDAAQIQDMEPSVQMDVLGGVLYPVDCHLHPGDYMETLKARLIRDGVKFRLQAEVTGFETAEGKVKAVLTGKEAIPCDQLVLAAGSWLPLLTRHLGINLLLQAGKGYSMTYPNVRHNLHHPAILVERRVAMTPMGRDLRLGGTMEISGIDSPVLMKRVAAIYHGAKAYYPGLNLSFPQKEDIWYGLRPLTPDGLPYIGRHSAYQNLILAGGHAMLGLSLSAATGKLVEELVSGKQPSIGLEAFSPERFG
jgi:D-amino-acid dehydrogenase